MCLQQLTPNISLACIIADNEYTVHLATQLLQRNRSQIRADKQGILVQNQPRTPTLHEPASLQKQLRQAASQVVLAVTFIKATTGVAALPHAQRRSQQLQAVASQLQLWPLTHCTFHSWANTHAC